MGKERGRGSLVRGRWFMGLMLIANNHDQHDDMLFRWSTTAPEYLNIEQAAAVVLHKTISVSMAHAADRGLRWVLLCVCWGLGRLCQEKILC